MKEQVIKIIESLNEGDIVRMWLTDGQIINGAFMFIDGNVYSGDIALRPIANNSKEPLILGWKISWITEIKVIGGEKKAAAEPMEVEETATISYERIAFTGNGNLYERYSSDCWFVRIGESTEPEYDCEHLEAAYQRHLRNQATS